jgi:hypothetical protein
MGENPVQGFGIGTGAARLRATRPPIQVFNVIGENDAGNAIRHYQDFEGISLGFRANRAKHSASSQPVITAIG